ncbi:MAG: c-type cytochrome [Undibacterium sp.]|nr:c-type cytochrome [Opitutaceae bacterium]
MLLRYPLFVALSVILAAPLAAQKGDRAGEVQDPPPTHIKVPPAPALSVEEAMKTFKVAPGFHLEVVAAEPLVHDPIAMMFGPDGRLWVLEMRGYMPDIDAKGENEPVGSIAVLEDTDGDGRMDKRTVFLDKLVMPRAFSLVDDGVLVAEPPHLWFARDKNGDGVADEKTEIATDYGNTTNPEHNSNGLMWAMDNWIYSANHSVRFHYGGGGKFSRDLTVSRGQWGISQDDVGRIYYNSNSDPLRVDAVPSAYLKRNPNFTATGSNVSVVPANLRVWPGRVTTGINRGYKSLDEEGKMFAVTAACGPVIYRGTLFPKEFLGDAFVCEPSGNLIKRIAIEARDGTVKGRNAYEGTEFITSTDERFRPVNLVNGPDGALYIVDLYRGVLQHRTYVTSYLRKQVEERALEQPRGLGRIYRIAPDNAPKAVFKSGLATATPEDLVKRLADENGWVRDTAQRLLVERRDAGVASALRAFAASSHNPLGRVHALWTLDGLGALDKAGVLRSLDDLDPRVVTVAVRLAEKFLTPKPDAEILARVTARTGASDASVRLQAAFTLGEVRTPAADAALRMLAINNPGQPFLIDAVVSGLGGREGAFITGLASETKNTATAPALAVAQATSAVLKSGEAARIDQVLALAGDATTPAWARGAVLDGVQGFLPKSPDGQVLLGSLPAEPKALVTLAAQKDSAEAPRATKLLASLKWPGKPGMAESKAEPFTPAQQALFEKGRAQFAAVCAACHQPTGLGLAGLAPPLVNSKWALGDERVLARIVLNGKAQENLIMPPMRAFDDETLAGVLTFVRRSWGHEAAAVAPKIIADARAAVAGRDEPWTEADLAELQQALAPARRTRKR